MEIYVLWHHGTSKDFVIMYTAELWVFQGGLTRAGGHVPWCSLLRGYYTLGTPGDHVVSLKFPLNNSHFGQS